MKKMITIMLAIVMAMAMTVTTYADQEVYIFDEASWITTASEAELNEKAAGIYAKTGIIVSYLGIETLGSESAYDYAEDAYKENFGKKDGILLIESKEIWNVYKQGKAEDIFDGADEDAMWAACSSKDYYNEGADAYLDVVSSILADEGIVAESEEESQPADKPESTSATTDNHPARFVDGADLLTADEEAELEGKLDEISTRQDFDVVIVTTDSLGGKTPEAFADDYFDYKGYGMGTDDDGILFAISMGERKWAISTHAYGIYAFTDAGQKYITDNITPYMSDGDFVTAFDQFADYCDDYVTQAWTGEPYDVDNMPDQLGILAYVMWLFPAYGIGAVIAFFLKKSKKKSLQTVMMRNDASDYWSDFHLTKEYDMFLHRELITVELSDDDDDDGGGSSVHVSSSGRTHGGSSGSF